MLNDNPIIGSCGLKGPLILAPLAGGPSTPELVAAVSNAGALGSLGLAYETPEQIHNLVQKTKALTDRPFAVNLFASAEGITVRKEDLESAIRSSKAYRKELEIPDPALKPPYDLDFDSQFRAMLSEKPRVFSFTFGLLDKSYLDECRKNHILTCGTATTLEEGLLLEESGVDWIVAQGMEAGGHRGIFSAQSEDPMIGVLPLVRALCSRLRIPVIAAGGIMDGEGIAAAITLGAKAAQLGTAFLLCEEAGTSPPYRNALREGRNSKTGTTRVFSGRIARGLPNRFWREMEKDSKSILPFPAQNAFTKDIRKRSVELGLSDFLSLWAGQGLGQIREGKAAELVATLLEEFRNATQS